MAISVEWTKYKLSNQKAETSIYITEPSTRVLKGTIYKAPGTQKRTKDYVVAKLVINGQEFISPGINVVGTWFSNKNSNAYIYEFEVTGCEYNTTYSATVQFYWSDNENVGSVGNLPPVVSTKWSYSIKTRHATGKISASGGISMDSDNKRPSMFKISCSTNPAADSAITYTFIKDSTNCPTIPDLNVKSSSNYTRTAYSSSIDSPEYYGLFLSYAVAATYDSDGASFLYTPSIMEGDNKPRVSAQVPYPTGSTGIGLSYNKDDDKVFVYAYTSSELYDRPVKIVWNNETLFDDTLVKNKDGKIKENVELIKDYYPAPSEDGTYYGSIEITNPDNTTYGSMTNFVPISSALSNDDSFKIEVSATNKLKVIFETGRKLTESKTATITATYSNKNQDYSTYSSFKKQDTIDLASGSYHFEPTLELGEDAPNGIYLITVSTGSTDTISKEITIIKKKEETNLTCTVEESARNPHRFYLTFENFVPGVKYDRTVKISLTKKSTATKLIDNQILLTKSTNTVTIPASDVARTTIANQYITWDKSKNIYDDTLTATINVYGTIDGKEVLLRSFTDLETIYPAWSPIQEFSWPEGQEVAVGKKFNITAETWNNLQLKVISSIENIIDDLDSSSIIDVQSGQTFTKDIYNNLISFLNLAEVKSYISATTDLPTAESITKYLNENHLFVYNTPMDLPIYDISKYGKALPQTVVITAKKLNDIVDRVNAIIRKLNSTSTTT